MRLAVISLLAACAMQATDPVCPETIEAFCAGKTQSCPTTWAAAQDLASWSCTDHVTLSQCGNVYVATNAGVDTGTDFYYDPTTGDLVRVSHYNVNSGTDTCIAGVGRTQVCNDPNAQPLALCPP